MRKVFWDNPYQQSLETKVSQVDGNVIVFSETIGFSECGGQESDVVTVNDIRSICPIDHRIHEKNFMKAIPIKRAQTRNFKLSANYLCLIFIAS